MIRQKQFPTKTTAKGNFGQCILGLRNQLLERMFDNARKNGQRNIEKYVSK